MNGYELVFKDTRFSDSYLFVAVVATNEERAIQIAKDSAGSRFEYQNTHVTMQSEGVISHNRFTVEETY